MRIKAAAAALASKNPAGTMGRFAIFVVVLALLAIPPVGGAQIVSDKLATPASFDIPAQALGTSLKQLADQAGIQILFEEAVVHGLRAPAIKAKQSAAQALDALLDNTGLEYMTEDATVAVRRKLPPATRPSTPPKAAASEAGIISAPGMQESSGNRRGVIRLAQNESNTVSRPASPADSADEQSQENLKLEEVIVTAEKRSRSLQDVPVSVTAFTAGMRDESGIITTQDLMNFAPGVSYSATTDRIAIRGIGRLTNQIGSDPGVAIYFDGVYDNSLLGDLGRSTLFVERIEVLRGPQGTLYGRNSVGGAVNLISRRPGNSFEAETRATVGDYQMRQLEARIAGPIGGGVRASLAGSKLDQDQGYFRNAAGGPDEGGVTDNWVVEGQLAFDLGSSFDAWLHYTTQDYHTAPRSANRVNGYNTASLARSGQIPNPTYLYETPNPGVRDHRVFATDQPSQNDLQNFHRAVAEMRWRAAAFDIKYTGGYLEYDFESMVDADDTARAPFTFPIPGPAGPFLFFPSLTNGVTQDQNAWTHELNFSSTGEGSLNWLLGLYYYRENFGQTFHVSSPDQPEVRNPIYLTAAPPFFAFAPPSPEGKMFSYDTELDTLSRAVYGQLDYDFSERWHGTLGLRYSRDDKEGFESNRILAWVPFAYGTPAAIDVSFGFPPLAPGPRSRTLEDTWEGYSGTLGLQWTPQDDTLLYGRYARGLKSGGFNLGVVAAEPFVDMETVDSVEFGWKQTLGSTFQINAAFFTNRYEGAQVPVTVRVGTGTFIPRFVNIPRSTTSGLEAETIWQPASAWRFMFNYSYLRARIDEGCCYIDVATNLPADVAGHSLPASPEHKVSFVAAYTLKAGPGDLTLSLLETWRSETLYSIFTTDNYRAPSYALTDLRATWHHQDGHLSLLASVRNVFDKEALDDVRALLLTTGSGARTFGLQPPRTASLELQYRF